MSARFYTYDDNGNITSVVQDGVTTSYTYDALGQLIRVVDGHEGATWEYSYDQGGNILSKKKYVDDTLAESKTFTYGNSNWKDQLTAVNGTTITYDQIGNPLSDGTWTYTWEKGRQLKCMSKAGTTASFKYNENGLRIQKTVNGVVTNYTLHGKNIVHMTQGSNSLHFYYDASNKPAIVEYNGVKYAYVHNLQGDIVAILDSNGNAVVQYKYDAWGRPISKTGSMASTLGTVQPFRYRGYVYDEETGLYYLRSRYYISSIQRFINSDLLCGNNQFAYCMNKPTNESDKDGFESSNCSDGAQSSGLEGYCDALEDAMDFWCHVQLFLICPLGVITVQSLHYNRNILNVTYSKQEIEAMKLEAEPEDKAKFHQNNLRDGENEKYVIGEWASSEVVFYATGELNNTPEDQGSFNVYSGDNAFLNVTVHGVFDVIPYMIWGNSPADSTSITDRIIMAVQ